MRILSLPGSGTSGVYGPDYLVAEDVVLVTVNYRWESFLETISQEEGGDMRYKKKDQKQDCLLKVGASWLSQPGQRHHLWQPGKIPVMDYYSGSTLHTSESSASTVSTASTASTAS